MFCTGKAAFCFEPFSNAWLERHVWVGFTFQSGWQMLYFHRIADRFKVIADTDKTNILLLGVVPFLPSLGSWKPFLLLLYICVSVGHSYLNRSAVIIKRTVCIFFYTLQRYLTWVIWGLLLPGYGKVLCNDLTVLTWFSWLWSQRPHSLTVFMVFYMKSCGYLLQGLSRLHVRTSFSLNSS